MRYINSHFTGRPLHTYLWFLWLTACWTIVLAVISAEPGRYTVKAKVFSVMGACSFILFLIRLLMLLAKTEDRKWLFSVYRAEEKKAARLDARIIVHLAPILGFIVLVEYWLIQDWQPE